MRLGDLGFVDVLVAGELDERLAAAGRPVDISQVWFSPIRRTLGSASSWSNQATTDQSGDMHHHRSRWCWKLTCVRDLAARSRQSGSRCWDDDGLQVFQAGQSLGELVAVSVGQCDRACSSEGTCGACGVAQTDCEFGSVGQCFEQVGR